VAVLDATASGTNTMSLKVTDDASATTKISWTIQNPAVLSLDTIVASSPVFRVKPTLPSG